MERRQIAEYLERNGASPFAKWFARLDPVAAAKVTTALYRLEQNGPFSCKPIGSGIAEYRIHHGPGYRVYFAQRGNRLIILLGGGTKNSQQRDIRAARRRWNDYRTREEEQEHADHAPLPGNRPRTRPA